jgi:glycine/D-amino acid oxidase-like deaminating enzyme
MHTIVVGGGLLSLSTAHNLLKWYLRERRRVGEVRT